MTTMPYDAYQPTKRKQRKQRESPLQDAILEFVQSYKTDESGHYDSDGNSPSYEEIAEALGISISTAYTTAVKMVASGKLRWNKRHQLVVGGKYSLPE